jgi:rod shape-determining protein MreC
LVISGQAQQLAAVLAENARYRALLNSAEDIGDSVLVAQVVAVTPDPARHQLVLDKGRADGIEVGQPLLGAAGLMGQIVMVGQRSARALLITDASHALPVQVNRNGVRGIAEGTGQLGRLVIRHIAATTDVLPGDLLVSSGLGGRFPAGYPVAEVVGVDLSPGAAFATVIARPLAALDRGRHVLVVVGPGNGVPAE